MGTCQCRNDDNLKDDINMEQNDSTYDIKNQPISKVKNACNTNRQNREELALKVSKIISSYGDKISENDFKQILPEQYVKYIETNPYQSMIEQNDQGKNEEDTVDLEPMKMQNGNFYWGKWNQDGEMSGEGKYYLADDQVLVEGNWINGILKKGRIQFQDGVYEGDIEENLFNGQGKIIYNSGITYEGDWVQGKKEGNGTMIWPDNSKYQGDFKQDIIHGYGTFEWDNGYSYVGYFSNGLFDGEGKLQGNNGSVYEGEFKMGKYEGSGCFTWNKMEDDSGNKHSTRYRGQYHDGKRHGNGTYWFDEQRIYDGEWMEGNPHGKGVVEIPDMRIYAIWRNGEVVQKIKEERVNSFSVTDSMINEAPNLNFKTPIENLDLKMCKYLAVTPEQLGINIAQGENLEASEQLFTSMTMYPVMQ